MTRFSHLDPTLDRKQIEKQYYDRGAKLAISQGAELQCHGPWAVEEHLRAPYLAYRQAIEFLSQAGDIVLDVGAGTGLNSFLAAVDTGSVLATDLSEAALSIAKTRGEVLGRDLLVFTGDAEQLPLRDQSVDLCTSAGVLYCLDVSRVTTEVLRVLKPGGYWVIVDSFNHSPIYKLNRLIGYWRGRRTKRAYTSIPDEETLALLRTRFDRVTVTYFGVWSFLWPLLRGLVGRERATRALAALEPPTRLSRFAFKILVVAQSPHP